MNFAMDVSTNGSSEKRSGVLTMDGIWLKLMKASLAAFIPTVSLLLALAASTGWWMWRIEDRLAGLEKSVAVEKRVNEDFRGSGERFTHTQAKDHLLLIGNNQAKIEVIIDDLNDLKRENQEQAKEIKSMLLKITEQTASR